MLPFSTYVINLNSDNERLRVISENLNALNIEFKRVEAIDARGEEYSSFKQYDAIAAKKMMGRELILGEIGCFLSHIRALTEFTSSNANYGLILEDDAVLPTDFESDLTKTLQWIENSYSQNWSYLHFGYSKAKFYTLIKDFGSKKLVAAHYAPMGAFAILWTKAGAKEFLANSARITAPFDNILQNRYTKLGGCLKLLPSHVTVADFASTMDGTEIFSKPERGNYRRSPTYGLLKQKRLWVNRIWALRNKAKFRT